MMKMMCTSGQWGWRVNKSETTKVRMKTTRGKEREREREIDLR